MTASQFATADRLGLSVLPEPPCSVARRIVADRGAPEFARRLQAEYLRRIGVKR